MHEILVLNAGSSSLKFKLFEAAAADREPRLLLSGQFAGLGGNLAQFDLLTPDGGVIEHNGSTGALATAADALPSVLDAIRAFRGADFKPSIVGHRIVHGGAQFAAPHVVDGSAIEALQALTPLAPLHMPAGVNVLRTMRLQYPKLQQIACFDTAFHSIQPEVATCVPLPKAYRDKGYRRYGFHGLNYEYITQELPRISGGPLPSRLMAMHLGNGASICAILDGRSIATTMSYSPLDGLIMGTRSGALDPGLVLALMRNEGLDADALYDLLYQQSGLRGLSGGTSDMRELLARDDETARFAVKAFCYWAARHAGSIAAALGGIDALVFTGGMGEKSAPVRAGIAAHMKWLGVEVHEGANEQNAHQLSPPSSEPSVWCIPANEELVIARHALKFIQPDGNRSL